MLVKHLSLLLRKQLFILFDNLVLDAGFSDSVRAGSGNLIIGLTGERLRELLQVLLKLLVKIRRLASQFPIAS